MVKNPPTGQECVLNRFHHVQFLATLWTVAHQVPLSMEILRQEYWSGLPFPSLGDLQERGMEPASLAYPSLAGRFFTPSATWEAQVQCRRRALDRWIVPALDREDPLEKEMATHVSILAWEIPGTEEPRGL